MNDAFIKTFSKANKVKKFQMLINNGYNRVSFVSKVDHSRSERPFHVVTLEDIKLIKTNDGTYVVNGIDIELSLIKEYDEKGHISKRWFMGKNREHIVYRSYKVDNILDGSISF